MGEILINLKSTSRVWKGTSPNDVKLRNKDTTHERIFFYASSNDSNGEMEAYLLEDMICYKVERMNQ